MLRTIKVCLAAFKMKMTERLQYRAASIAGATTSIFFVATDIIIYSVFYHYSANIAAGAEIGLPFEKLVPYIWLAQILFLIQPLGMENEIREKITSGNVGVELCRPIDLYWHWYAKTSADKISGLVWRGGIILLASIIAIPTGYGITAPDSLLGFFLFLISVVSAFFLCNAYNMLMAALRLNITWGDGPIWMLQLISSVFSGTYFPLQLWPDSMQKLIVLQPFAGYTDIPLRLYLGTMSITEAAWLIVVQIIWLFIFIAIGRFVMKKRMSSLIVQGG